MSTNFSHLQTSDVQVLVFCGLCEIVNDHYHPCFLFVFEDNENKTYWMQCTILDSIQADNHKHFYDPKSKDIKRFFKSGSIVIKTKSNDGDHEHELQFLSDNRQGMIFSINQEI